MSIHKYTSIEEFMSSYTENPKIFNMMVEVQSVQDIGPMYKPVINMVFLSTDLEDGDIYIQKNAKDPYGNDYREPRYSISRKGLMLIKSAAKASFLDPVIIYDKENGKYRCSTNMRYMSSKGDWLVTACSKEVPEVINTRNKKYDNTDPARKAESGAQNACIREAFRIKGHYSKEQLENPFVMIYLELDETKDDDVKMAKIAAAIGSTQMLFGSRQNNNLRQLASGTTADVETGEVIDGGKANG